MGIKYSEKHKQYIVSYSKRHPITRDPYSLTRRAKTKAEAIRLYAQLIIEVEDRLRKTILPTWTELIDQLEESMLKGDYSRKTVDNYAICLRGNTIPLWGDRLVDNISGDEIREVINVTLEDKSKSHRKNMLKYIRAAFNHAVEKKYIQVNPTPSISIKIGDKLKSVLTLDQARILLEQAKKMDMEWYPIWAFALYTGMRNGELYALTWEKIDLQKRIIRVDSAWNIRDGFKDTKSGDDRNVEIADDLIPIFNELKLKNENPPFVLPRLEKWTKGEQAHELRMFLAGLGLPRIRFHDLRATWATILISRGVPPAKVMKGGGWRHIKTMDRYIREAGIDVKGLMEGISIHDPRLQPEADVLDFTKSK